MKRTLFLCALTCALLGGPAAGQDLQNLEEPGRFRFGPARVTPSIHITNFGVDTNVFNEFENPKQDLTASMGPGLDVWLRLGRARLTGRTALDYNYFNEYDTQRHLGTRNTLRLSVPLSRLTPFVEGAYTNTRQRPGYEIDARARRMLLESRAGLDVRFGGRTLLTLAGGRRQFLFDANEQFLGAELREALNNDSDTFDVTLARQLTPLTTFVVMTEQRRDRFRYSPGRDADALKVVTGFDFKPFALVSGTIRVGWRQFETLEPLVPDYSGLVASGELEYAMRATRIGFRVARDVEYSFQQVQPYYLLTDLQADVTQRLTTHWDVVGRAGRQALDYRAVALRDDVARLDRLRRLGGGVGYRLGEFVRLGFDVNRDQRTSDITFRRYEAWRAGGTLSYGIKAR